jgi:hypothetical protein
MTRSHSSINSGVSLQDIISLSGSFSDFHNCSRKQIISDLDIDLQFGCPESTIELGLTVITGVCSVSKSGVVWEIGCENGETVHGTEDTDLGKFQPIAGRHGKRMGQHSSETWRRDANQAMSRACREKTRNGWEHTQPATGRQPQHPNGNEEWNKSRTG